MKNIARALFLLFVLAASASASAATSSINGLKISTIRAVGQYQDPQFSNTIELWFTTTLTWPAGSPCTNTYRVYVDVKNYHLVAAAYLAFSKGRSLNITVDDTLPIRYGACEITLLDVLSQ
jgi:type III secretory pathway component EscS